MNMVGAFGAVQGAKNLYQYNGKELNEDFGLDWNDYGARWYDASVGRFNTIDPLAENYPFQSPYVYAANNPVIFFDFMGLGPIYGPDGTLIGYEVEEGQGPTQIAQDLNEYYSCQLTCEISWTEIVYNNAEQFHNVFDGEGNIEDEYNGDYKSGNIEPGDVLEITNGINISEVNRVEGEIDDAKNKLQDVHVDIIEEEDRAETSRTMRNEVGDPSTGDALGQIAEDIWGWRAEKINTLKREKRQIQKKVDSLELVKEGLKKD